MRLFIVAQNQNIENALANLASLPCAEFGLLLVMEKQDVKHLLQLPLRQHLDGLPSGVALLHPYLDSSPLATQILAKEYPQSDALEYHPVFTT